MVDAKPGDGPVSHQSRERGQSGNGQVSHQATERDRSGANPTSHQTTDRNRSSDNPTSNQPTDRNRPGASRISEPPPDVDRPALPIIELTGYRHPPNGDPDSRALAALLHVAFYLLLSASLIRFLDHHPADPQLPWVGLLCVGLAVAYGVGLVLGFAWQDEPVDEPSAGWLAWLGSVLALWVVLVLLAPSFAWCAIPLFVSGLRTLPTRWAVGLVAVVTVLAVISQNRLAKGFDPNLSIVPIAVGSVTTAVIVHMRQQATRLRETEHQAGRLAERQRLSMEIHDALAQGLSSQAMLLQAADRVWDERPEAARDSLSLAAMIATRNLAEARRLVHDLAPADLAEAGLEEALGELAARESAAFTVDGEPRALPDRVQRALLRIAQSALANAREHAEAERTGITLTYLDHQVVLDVADDGRGFDATYRVIAGERGHGLAAMRARMQGLGGRLTVESAPGQGTVISASVPVENTRGGGARDPSVGPPPEADR